MPPTVDPKVVEFRLLKLSTLDDLLREADRLAAAEQAGTLRTTGNWTLGQTLGHLAAWIDFPFDGYPPEIKPPWFVKALLRMRKKQFLHAAMPRGVRIPKIEGGTLGTAPMPTDEGLRRIRAAVERLKAGAPPHPNPIFGRLSHQEWIAGNLRHAELHFGYLQPV